MFDVLLDWVFHGLQAVATGGAKVDAAETGRQVLSVVDEVGPACPASDRLPRHDRPYPQIHGPYNLALGD